MKWAFALVLLALAGSWGAWLLSEGHSEKPVVSAVTSAPPPAREPSKPAAKAASERAQTQHKVDEAVERAAQTVTKDNLPQYLDELLQRARKQGRITALEASVGTRMIMRTGGDLDELAEFNTKLNALAAELRGEVDNPEPPSGDPIAELSAIGDRLDSGDFRDEDERRSLFDAYIRRAGQLDPEEMAPAMQRLNALAAKYRAPTPQPIDLDQQWRTIEGSSGPPKQAAIKTLLNEIGRLPPDQQAEHLERLNAVVD